MKKTKDGLVRLDRLGSAPIKHVSDIKPVL